MSSKAIELYDKDSDGQLSAAELEAIPAVKKHFAIYDQDGDQAVSQEELKARFAGWKEQGLAFQRLDVSVKMRGRALSGALVTFEPEPYMSESMKPATGTTDRSGMAKISVAEQDLPEALKGRGLDARGLYVGTYKIKVTHPTARIPDAYQSGAALGAEIARDTVSPTLQIEIP